jgi:tetratricopeptide (TPR) repeat protein
MPRASRKPVQLVDPPERFSAYYTGDIVESRKHFDRAIAFYHPAEHRPLATRFGVDARVSVLCYRSWALWLLGYPEAALASVDHAVRDAKEIAQAASLMFALGNTAFSHFPRGDYAEASSKSDEIMAFADEKAALFWKARHDERRLRIGRN